MKIASTYIKSKVLLPALLLAMFRIGAQSCPIINFPAPGSTGVPVDVTITWPPVSGHNGYSLTLGTTPGGQEILTRRSAGLINSFRPPTGLPENTRIYVTISMFLDDGAFIFCNEEMYFDTEDVTTPPHCTTLSIPENGDTNVNNTAEITWNYAPTATGYIISMGSTPGGSEFLTALDVGNRLGYNPQNLPPETTVFVRITPYNENGAAGTCTEEQFTTGSGTINCGPFRDPITGQSVRYGPELNFPDLVSVCLNELPTRITANDAADGYRWYRINQDNSETMISATAEVFLTDLGLYRYEAYNEISQNETVFECAESRIFRVIASELPTIAAINRENNANGADLTIEVEGNGIYEFALDNGEGTYQESPFFEDVTMGVHTIFVRDRNGCGVREKTISLGLPSEAFPRFFTPNGDGINDYWQFKPTPEFPEIRLKNIYIFDRFGSLLAQVDPLSSGWDGNMNGRPMPATNYWFRASDDFNNEITGYFALKR